MGEWKDDFPNGQIKVTTQEIILDGIAKSEAGNQKKMIFSGTITDITGTGTVMHFDGSFEKDPMQVNGEAKIVLADGSVQFEGCVTDTFTPHGFAKYLARDDGSVYVGEVQKGEFHGHGRLTSKNGDIFEGEIFVVDWVVVTMILIKLSLGDFEHGMRARGRLEYANDNAVFDGIWRDSAWWTGTLTSKDGKVRQYVDGKVQTTSWLEDQ